MAKVLGRYITNDMLERAYGLIPIEEAWNELHARRMMMDRRSRTSGEQLLLGLKYD